MIKVIPNVLWRKLNEAKYLILSYEIHADWQFNVICLSTQMRQKVNRTGNISLVQCGLTANLIFIQSSIFSVPASAEHQFLLRLEWRLLAHGSGFIYTQISLELFIFHRKSTRCLSLFLFFDFYRSLAKHIFIQHIYVPSTHLDAWDRFVNSDSCFLEPMDYWEVADDKQYLNSPKYLC